MAEAEKPLTPAESMAVLRHPLWIAGRMLGVLSAVVVVTAAACGVVVAVVNDSSETAGFVVGACAVGLLVVALIIDLWGDKCRAMARDAIRFELGGER